MKSTGPKSEEGRTEPSQRADAWPSPRCSRAEDEDAGAAQEFAGRWNEFYKPASPGEQELIDRASAPRSSGSGATTSWTALAAQVRTAQRRQDEALRGEIDRVDALLWGDDPGTALQEAQRTAAGCRLFLGYWETIAGLFATAGYSRNPRTATSSCGSRATAPSRCGRMPAAS